MKTGDYTVLRFGSRDGIEPAVFVNVSGLSELHQGVGPSGASIRRS